MYLTNKQIGIKSQMMYGKSQKIDKKLLINYLKNKKKLKMMLNITLYNLMHKQENGKAINLFLMMINLIKKPKISKMKLLQLVIV